MTRYISLLSLSAVAFLLSVPAAAQYPVLAELYGRGVHAYNANNMMQAHEYLSMAIDNGSKDPRAFYFRGAVNAATGRQLEAESDWKMAAQLEVMGEYGLTIGRSLSRIQGGLRMQMETVRQQVRLEQRAAVSKRNQLRYDELKAAEGQVLRGGTVQPVTPPPVAEVDDSSNPFADDAMGAGEATPDASGNPFGDDAGAGASPAPAAGGDPFSSPAPAAGAAPADASDPFSSPAPAGGAMPADAGDPFSAPAGGAAPADASDPFSSPAPAGGAMPADAGDPFSAPAAGVAPAADTSDPFSGGSSEPAGPTPATDSSDPFGAGGDSMEGGAMESDPFGGTDPFAS